MSNLGVSQLIPWCRSIPSRGRNSWRGSATAPRIYPGAAARVRRQR